jgi:hypothetical protein
MRYTYVESRSYIAMIWPGYPRTTKPPVDEANYDSVVK